MVNTASPPAQPLRDRMPQGPLPRRARESQGSRPARRAAYVKWGGLALLLIALLALWAPVYAQGAHPFGAPERGAAALPVPDVMQRFFGYVSYWQSHFYRQLTAAVRAWQADGGWGGVLIGLSFAYGVFHALGPGHGKAVIASYVLANRQTARNGALLALIASLLQALVAIAAVSVLAIVFNVTARTMNDATRWLEIAAYTLIVALGAVLVWRKVLRPVVRAIDRRRGRGRDHGTHGHAHRDHGTHAHTHAHDHRATHTHAHAHDYRATHAHAHAHDHRAIHHHTHHHHHDDDACCGHSHAPALDAVEGRLDWRRAWLAILAIGLRPCSGALIVLVFALAQDFYRAGVLSALAMGVGTGLTVAALAILSAWAGAATERMGGALSSRAAVWTRRGIEGFAAVSVLLLGLVLLGAHVVSPAGPY